MRRCHRRGVSWAVVTCLCVCVVSWTAFADGFELMPNGGVEKMAKGGKPVGWGDVLLKDAKGKHSVDTKVFHSGTRSLKIEAAPGNTGHYCWRSARIPINVTKETKADLSLWIRAEDSPWLMVRVVTRDAKNEFVDYLTPFSIELGGFFDWKEFRKTITLKPGATKLAIYLVQPRAGTVWFDDIKLVAKKDIRGGGKKRTTRAKPKPLRTAATTTASTDMLEFRNYVKNPRAVGPLGENDLPWGWSVHNPPGVETIGKVVWAKDDPRPGFHGLCVVWQGGGRYIATRPALVKPITGERPLKFQSYAKTVDGGRAYLLAQCVDKAGKVLLQGQSNIVQDAKDYATCRLNFVTHPDTADVRLYCVNGGTGKVWFHWTILEPDMDAVKRMAKFPYMVSAEPAEGNRFWNDGKAVLHSFEDSPVSACFAFWGDKGRLDDPKLIIEAPATLKVPEAFNEEPRAPVSHAKAEFSTAKTTRDGTAYVRYTFEGPAALQRMKATPYLHNHMVTCFIPKAGVADREFTIYYHAENGGIRSTEKSFMLRVLPSMKKTPNPKRFISHLWTLDDINFYDLKLVEKVATRFEEAALAGRERWTNGREEIHRVDQLLKKRGWFLFYETAPAAYGFRQSKVGIIGGDGKPGRHHYMYCPTNAILDAEFYEKTVVPYVRKALEENQVEDGEWVFVDYEPGSIATKYCFCELCKKTFAKRSNIPYEKVSTRRDILMNYSKEWGENWVWLCDEILRLHVESFKRVNPTLKHLEYCYAIWFNKPEALATKLFNSPLDTRLNQKHMDRMGLSFYHLLGKTAFDILDANTRVLEKPCLTMPLMGTTTPYWGNFTDDQILTPDAMRQQVLIAASTGAAGVMPYQGKLMDGMYVLSIDRAMSEIAKLEDFYMDGARVDEKVSFEAIAGKDWNDYIGIRAHTLKGATLLTVFNFHKSRAARLRIGVASLEKGKWRVLDAVTRKPLPSVSSEPAQGLSCGIAAEDVVFLLLEQK